MLPPIAFEKPQKIEPEGGCETPGHSGPRSGCTAAAAFLRPEHGFPARCDQTTRSRAGLRRTTQHRETALPETGIVLLRQTGGWGR